MLKTLGLYSSAVLIWGTTWIAITFQLGVVSPEVSLVYRFGIAVSVLFVFALAARRSLTLSLTDHAIVAAQGLLMFAAGYLLIYFATRHLTSGLVAVIFSSIVFFNLINERIFFGARLERRVVAAAIIGFVGISVIFAPEFVALKLDHERIRGLMLVLAATYVDSVANMIAERNSRRGLSALQVNAWGMLYGLIALTVFALLRGQPFVVEWTPRYLGSLVYLGVFGSAIAFGCFMLLLGRIGASRAAYIAVLFPVVALSLSALFEGWHWTPWAVSGAALVLFGNVLALTRIRAPLPLTEGA